MKKGDKAAADSKSYGEAKPGYAKNYGEAKKRIEKLRQVIHHQRYVYHVLDKEGISDEAHDSLKHELWELEQQFPGLITKDSPTQRVGGEPLDTFKKVQHAQPMLSIEDIFGAEEFAGWEDYIARLIAQEGGVNSKIQNTKSLRDPEGSSEPRTADTLEYFAELKIDGFAVTLIYRKGVLETAATRGNGQVGENVTQNVKTLESIPLRLSAHWRIAPLHEAVRGSDSSTSLGSSRIASRDEESSGFRRGRGSLEQDKLSGTIRRNIQKAIAQGTVEVRGEVYMNKKAFEKFNAQRVRQGEEVYANPRNLAAGSIRQLDPALAAARPLEFLAYDLIGDFGQEFHSQEHEILQAIGFKTDATAKICQNSDEVLAYWNATAKQRDALPFQIDGVVVQINRNKIVKTLGVVGKGYRGMRALKFAGKQATTRVLDIQTQIGRTGAVTPVAVLSPVQVAGVTISRATLHNEDELKRLDVRIGDTVIIQRAGDVIPAVVEVLVGLRDGTEKAFRMPRLCPICKSPLEKPEGEAVTRCLSKNCQAKVGQQIKHFVSKKAFNIEGLGPNIIAQLMSAGLVQNAGDLFELTQGDVAALERFANKSAENLIDAIQQSKSISFDKFLYALGIRHVGEETAQALARNFPARSRQATALAGRQLSHREPEGSSEPRTAIYNYQTLTIEDLEQVFDIGPKSAESIYRWFHTKENIEFIKRLEKLGIKIQYAKKTVHSGVLQGKVFVLTGSLLSMTRDEAKEKIRQAGADVSESVSKNTDYVVAGESPGVKLQQAKKLRVPVLTEKEFLILVNVPSTPLRASKI